MQTGPDVLKQRAKDSPRFNISEVGDTVRRASVCFSLRYALRNMTVCIAGICRDGVSPRFVLCSDRRIGDDLSGGDVCIKLDHAGDGWLVMFAGSVSRARAFAARLRKHLVDRTNPMDSLMIAEEFEACAFEQRRSLINKYVQSQFSFSYEELLAHGKDWLPIQEYEQMSQAIRSIDLGCELILTGFIEGLPFLFTIRQDCTVSREESFAVIGAGYAVAQAALFQRRYERTLQVQEAAYYIFRGKRLSEVAPGVGPETTIAISRRSDQQGYTRYRMLNPFTMDRLYAQYKELGFQKYKPLPHDEFYHFFSIPENRSMIEPASSDGESKGSLEDLERVEGNV